MSWDGFPARQWQGYPPEFWIGGAASVALQNAGPRLAQTYGFGPGARWALAVGAALSLILVMRGVVRHIRHQDEFHRQISLQATAYAAGLVIFLSLSLGAIEQLSTIPHLPASWAAVVLVFAQSIAFARLKRHYG